MQISHIGQILFARANDKAKVAFEIRRRQTTNLSHEYIFYLTTIKTLHGDSSTMFEEVDLAHQRPKALS